MSAVSQQTLLRRPDFSIYKMSLKKIPTRQLGKNGPTVSSIAFGSMSRSILPFSLFC